ncbi:MAG: type II toxin-antitoxin system VapC family toxin [Candidatus Nanohalobium sp.]
MIFDTSSLVKILTEGEVEKLFDEKILDLTFYETGNVFWKMHNLQNRIEKEELAELIKLIDRLEKEMEAIRPDREKVMKIASKHEITLYDASYLTTAKEAGEKLATEDSELAEVAEEEGVEITDTEELN